MNKYIIPTWCSMPKESHHDNIGGCWGITYGLVARNGNSYCIDCEYYRG